MAESAGLLSMWHRAFRLQGNTLDVLTHQLRHRGVPLSGRYAEGRVFWVNTTGDDAHLGTYPESALATVTAALAKCEDGRGDVIVVMASEADSLYTIATPIIVNKRDVTIVAAEAVGRLGGENAGRVTFDSDGAYVFDVRCPCIISGFTFIDASDALVKIGEGWNFSVNGYMNVLIHNCHFLGGGGATSGILITSAAEVNGWIRGVEITGCCFNDLTAGVACLEVDDNVVPFYVYMDDITIEDCTFIECSVGISTYTSKVGGGTGAGFWNHVYTKNRFFTEYPQTEYALVTNGSDGNNWVLFSDNEMSGTAMTCFGTAVPPSGFQSIAALEALGFRCVNNHFSDAGAGVVAEVVDVAPTPLTLTLTAAYQEVPTALSTYDTAEARLWGGVYLKFDAVDADDEYHLKWSLYINGAWVMQEETVITDADFPVDALAALIPCTLYPDASKLPRLVRAVKVEIKQTAGATMSVVQAQSVFMRAPVSEYV